MREFYERNKWPIWIILISIILVAGVMLYRKYNNRTTATPRVSVAIDAPAKVSSGSEIIYKITFSNKDSQSIRDLKLDLLYPQGFNFLSSSPSSTKINGTQFSLPNLEPSQEGTLMIKGNISGNVGETKTVNAVLHYSYANFNSDFIAQAQSQTLIQDSDLLVQFEGPNKTSNNQQITYSVSYTNAMDADIKGARLKLDIPGAFKVSKFDTNPSVDGTFSLGDIKANSNGKFSFSGAFVGANVGDQLAFSASINGQSGSNPDLLLGTAQYSVQIGDIPLSLKLSAVDNSSQSRASDVVLPGDNLSYTVEYKNNSSTSVTNAIISVTLNGAAYDLASIQAQNAHVSGNVVTWDASQNSSFGTLSPNESGSLLLIVAVKNPATKTSAKDLSISASSIIKADEYKDGFVGDTVTSKIATVARIETSFQSTGLNTYLVTISLRNSSSDIDSAVVTFNVPNASGFSKDSFVGTEAANASYNSSSKKVTWNVGKLAAHTGDFSALRKLQFNVTLPVSNTIFGQQNTLANNIVLTGNDVFTNTKVNVTAQDITVVQ